MIIPAVVSVCLFGSLWIHNEYERFKKETVALREDYFDTQKRLIKSETGKVIDYIEYKRSQAEERLKQIIKGRTNEAYDIALNLYSRYKTSKSPAEIQQLIIEALRPIRYNNRRGYYFITRLDGTEILFADRPEMEGRNLIDMQDTQGKFVIRDMINIIKKSGHGFYRYTWTKPQRVGKDFPKIAYIKLFEPFDWRGWKI
jgi:signal transduction histidine kinase